MDDLQSSLETWHCANRCCGKLRYSIAAMPWGVVELEPEVEKWLDSLPTAQFAHAAFYVDLLAEQGPLLGEPYTKQLDRNCASCGSTWSGARSESPTGSRPTRGSSS